MVISNPKRLVRILILMIVDAVTVMAGLYIGVAIRFDMDMQRIDPEFMNSLLSYAPMHIITIIVLYFTFRVYQSLWEYAGFNEVRNIAAACFIAMFIEYAGIHLLGFHVPRSSYITSNAIIALITITNRLAYRFIRLKHNKLFDKEASLFAADKRMFAMNKADCRVMIVGGGQAGIMLIKEIRNSGYLNETVCCIIDDDPGKLGRYVQGVKIIGNRNDIPSMVTKYHIDKIIIAMPSAPRVETTRILEICKQTDCELMIQPGLYQIINGDVSVSKLRKVEIEDLLGREPVSLDMDSISGYIAGKTILITGGGGSIGSELCRQVVKHPIARLIIVDIYENNAYEIQQELCHEYPELELHVIIASVRDYHRMDQIFEQFQPDIIYHAAAHKHVPLMEYSPNEAIKNNAGGTYNMVRLADKWHVKRFVLISTDKAVNPTNIMGASKRLCEMIVQTYNRISQTEYVAVRFGNVMGSNGSVIPLFRKQIAEGGPVEVTHPDIIRYFMLIPEAAGLVIQAGAYAKGGEIFVLDMGEPVKIYDLAKNMIRLAGLKLGEDIDIKFIGLRPGEKLYEEMLMQEEGLQDTPNKLIHIGKPIEMDDDIFLPRLEELISAANHDVPDMKERVRKLVDTYVITE